MPTLLIAPAFLTLLSFLALVPRVEGVVPDPGAVRDDRGMAADAWSVVTGAPLFVAGAPLVVAGALVVVAGVPVLVAGAPRAAVQERAELAGALVSPETTHGKIAWFRGSYTELLAEAARTEKLVFLDFWTSWCTWCKRLDRETFSDPAVVEEMSAFLCLPVDGESPEGRELALRFGVTGYPALLFLEPDGRQRDAISGYLAAPKFLEEVRRIRRDEGTLGAMRKRVLAEPKSALARLELAGKLRRLGAALEAQREVRAARDLAARGEGFDTSSVEVRWALAQGFEAAGDDESAKREIRAIEALDPDCKSLVRRRLRITELVQAFQREYVERRKLDTAALEAFLAGEPYPELRFLGWNRVQDAHEFLAEEARKRENEELRVAERAAMRRAGALAWKDCPPEGIAGWGKYLAWTFYEDEDRLSAEERALMVAVAERALAAAPESAEHMEMLACALHAAGRHEEALALLEKAIERHPERTSLRERHAELSR